MLKIRQARLQQYVNCELPDVQAVFRKGRGKWKWKWSSSVVSDFLRPRWLYSPPGSSIHGIAQARILEWVAISFSKASSRPRDPTRISCIGRQILYHWATWKACGKVLSIVKARLHHSQLFNMLTVFQYNTSSSFGWVDGTPVTEATNFRPWGRLVWGSSWNADTGPCWH